MRLLVLSDSHGNSYFLRQAMLSHPEADKIIFLGDGERDFHHMEEELGSRELIMVRGNCDFGSELNDFAIFSVGRHTVFCTHGYRESVKYGEEMLIEKAKNLGADVVLYGHTHEQTMHIEDNIHIMNPGSINDGHYGLVDIVSSGILMSGK